MATQLQLLRRKAKAAGVSVSALRSATSAAEIKTLIAQANGTARKSTARKAVRKAVPAVKKSRTAKKSPAAKSTRGKAKRTSPTPKARSNGKSGRNLISTVDFDKTKGWNPRVGSAPDRIIKALKRFKGNRDKAFDLLLPDVWDFVGKTKRNGEKRTKQEAQDMLRYRISRTLFDFTIQTKQHKVSTNRIEYGTGPNAKPKSKRGRPARKAAQAAPKRRGRPPGSKNKATAKRGPGRPRGSKNKTK